VATLTIRNLPDSVRDALRVRAASNGRSMEAEARALIMNHVATLQPSSPPAIPPEILERVRKAQAMVRAALGPPTGREVDDFIAERRAEARLDEAR
jgi:plasmid stability protein